MRMKRKWILAITVVLLLSIIVLARLMKPERTLGVGSQVDESGYEFTKVIGDKEKISEYEEWFAEIDFSAEIEEPTGYAEIIVFIRDHKQGIYRHPVSIWIDGNNITVTNEIGFTKLGGKISNSQLEELERIIN